MAIKDNTSMDELNSLIRTYKNTIDQYKESVYESYDNEGITEDLLKNIKYMEDSVIENLTIADINEMLEESGCDNTLFKNMHYHSADKSVPYIDFTISVIKEIKNKLNELDSLDKEYEELDKNKDEIANKYIEAIKSPEYRQARINQIKKLKEQAETVEDPVEKAKILKRLDIINRSQKFTFLNERLKEIGEKEVRSIKDSFFDNLRGEHTLNRYKTRLKRFGINPSIHMIFLNMEEKLLPESYHVYNNFFLFHVMRFIGYQSPEVDEELLYVSNLFTLLKDVCTNDCTEEEKDTLIRLMKEFHSYFANYYDYFKEKNASYKESPVRKAHEEELRKKEEEKAAKEHEEHIFELIRTELGEKWYSDKLRSMKNPEAYLSTLITEKLKMLDYIADNGYEYTTDDDKPVVEKDEHGKMVVTHPDAITYHAVYDKYFDIKEANAVRQVTIKTAINMTYPEFAKENSEALTKEDKFYDTVAILLNTFENAISELKAHGLEFTDIEKRKLGIEGNTTESVDIEQLFEGDDSVFYTEVEPPKTEE